MRRTLKTAVRVLFLLLMSSALFAGCGWCAPAESDLDAEIAAQEMARSDLDKKIEQYNETAKKKAQQAQSLLGRITNLKQNSKMAQQQIRVLELQSNRLQKSMAGMNREMAEVSAKVNSLVIELRSRLVSMYKYGSREELNLLLSAEDTHEAIASAYLMERLARHDRVVIDDLLRKLAELERAKNNLEKNRTQLSAQTRELGLQRTKYESSVSETSTVLSGVRRDQKKAEEAAREIEQAQKEIGRTIMALLERKKARTDGSTSAEVRTYPTLARGSMLDWPIKGPIVSPYGSRTHPVFKTKSFNSGIDIRAAANAPVASAGPGEVLFEGWLRGFGQVVIVDHGNNISTVYANLASTRVKERDAVKSGTVVGTVGNTGTTTENCLHFEVRVGDAAKNPMDYLKRL